MKSYIPGEVEMQKQWHVIDAEGQILGRLATQAANMLTGKTNPYIRPL